MINIKKLAKKLNKLILEVSENSKPYKAPQEIKRLSAEIKFTREEVMQMPKYFRKMFRALGCVAYVLKYFGNNQICYEIRFFRNGYNVSVCSSSLEVAKKLFIAEVIKLYD